MPFFAEARSNGRKYLRFCAKEGSNSCSTNTMTVVKGTVANLAFPPVGGKARLPACNRKSQNLPSSLFQLGEGTVDKGRETAVAAVKKPPPVSSTNNVAMWLLSIAGKP